MSNVVSEPLLTVQGLVKHFHIHQRQGWRMATKTVRAVDGIDLTVAPGETVGLVGESGCGKSTAGRAILRLLQPTSGQVTLEGENVLALQGEGLRQIRQRMNIVFQDPYAALDPRMMIGDIIAEPLRAHRMVASRAEGLERARELLQSVGLRPEFATRYGHEFSGGQRQRIGIARALATNPKLLILDEPTSALDVSIRAQILNLLSDIQAARGLGYLFIAHDLSIVRHFCDRVCVMYLGIIVEEGPSERVFSTPRHPYSHCCLHPRPLLTPHCATNVRFWKATCLPRLTCLPAAASVPAARLHRIFALSKFPFSAQWAVGSSPPATSRSRNKNKPRGTTGDTG